MKTSLLTLAAFALTAFAAHADDLAKCPPFVQDAIRANAGAGKIDDVDIVQKNGATQYVAKIEMPDAHDLKIHIAADGSFIESRQEIRLGDAPVPVQAAFKSIGHKVEDLHRIVSPGGVSYVAKVEGPNGPEQRIAVTEDGAILGQVQKRD